MKTTTQNDSHIENTPVKNISTSEQSDLANEQRLRKYFGTWTEISAACEEMRVSAREHETIHSRRFRYPMRYEIKISMKRPTEIAATVAEDVSSYINSKMVERKKSDAVLTCEVCYVNKRKRQTNDFAICSEADLGSALTLASRNLNSKRDEAKIIICSLERVRPSVEMLFKRLNNLLRKAENIPIQIRLRLGSINTLEFLSESGEDDFFCGF